MQSLPLLPLATGVAGVKRTRSHPELDLEQALVDYHEIAASLDGTMTRTVQPRG